MTINIARHSLNKHLPKGKDSRHKRFQNQQKHKPPHRARPAPTATCYYSPRRVSPHRRVVNLVRSGRKQPQLLYASAGGKARHLSSPFFHVPLPPPLFPLAGKRRFPVSHYLAQNPLRSILSERFIRLYRSLIHFPPLLGPFLAFFTSRRWVISVWFQGTLWTTRLPIEGVAQYSYWSA